jgi:AraC-like DNA-binding protein
MEDRSNHGVFGEFRHQALVQSRICEKSVRGLPLAGAEKVALDECLLALLLHYHPHNYSEELARTVPTPIPRAVRGAERFIIDNADSPITVSDVADHLGISLRSLQTGFRQWRETTLNCVLAARSIGACVRRASALERGGQRDNRRLAARIFGSRAVQSPSIVRPRGDPSATLRRGRAALVRP